MSNTGYKPMTELVEHLIEHEDFYGRSRVRCILHMFDCAEGYLLFGQIVRFHYFISSNVIFL